MWKDIEEQSKKDIEIGETYDALFGDVGVNPSPQTEREQEAVATGEAQGPIVAQLALNAEEQQGTPEAAQIVRQNVGGLAEGVAGEKALLLQAQTGYSNWMTTFLASDRKINVNGKEMTVREAASSLDPFVRQQAMVAGRREFIQSNGLQYATKANVVKYLANTVIQAESAIGSSLANSAIKAERERVQDNIKGIGYSAAQAGDNPPQALYNDLSEQLFVQNTGLTEVRQPIWRSRP